MKPYLILLTVMLQGVLLSAQTDTWKSFWNSDTTLIGFYDRDSIIRIVPKFIPGLTGACRFNHIMTVAEEEGDDFNIYYLTKQGKAVGRDSVYFFDNTPDCEYEGFIRFKVKKKDKTGLFNRYGKIVVPPVYTTLTEVRNNMLVGLIGGKKKYFEKKRHRGCNHYTLKGGKKVLLDTANHILVNNFNDKRNLDFYSLLITTIPHPDTLRVNYKGVDGRYYSFIDFDKEFKVWLNNTLPQYTSRETLPHLLYHQIIYWDEDKGWITQTADSFAAAHYDQISELIQTLQDTACDYFVIPEGLNPFIYETPEYDIYFNNCRDALEGKYPLMTVVINRGTSQRHLQFLRTSEGYKLIDAGL